MRLGSRLRRLELSLAPAECDCPITTQYELAGGVIYPPAPPCLRGRCPKTGGASPIRKIILGRCNRDGADPRCWPLSVRDFEVYDPETQRPRVRVIVWRDEVGKLCYHGPPRWWELGGEPPRIVRAPGVTETEVEIVEELRAGRPAAC